MVWYYSKKVEQLKEQNEQLLKNNESLRKDLVFTVDRYQEVSLAFAMKNIVDLNPLDFFALENYKKIDDIAYKEKRIFHDKYYSIYLNELITPNAWEVLNFKKKIDTHTDVDSVGRKLAKTLTWSDDGKLSESGDYYLTPSETLVYKNVDCEDHAFCFASLLPKTIGVAYGFYKGVGHAFNVFVNNNILYIVDTVGDSCYIEEVKKSKNYVIHFIITQNGTYRVKSGVQFGKLASWY